MNRKYLFLQGPVGPFFQELGKAVAAKGSQAWRINFNGGDRYFWDAPNAIDFKDKIDEFKSFIKKTARNKKITDLVIYGDCRPVHKIAIQALQNSNVKIHVFEEGYFRPDWITLEENGVNARSSLPRDAEFYKALPEKPFPKALRFRQHFKSLIWYSALYYIHGARKMYGEFKNYRHHFNISPHVTIGRWLIKMVMRRHKPMQSNMRIKEISKTKYFLVPLQLCRDYQIKDHSQFGDMTEFVDFITQNFAKNAQDDTNLVFKIHPLDNNPGRLEKYIFKSAKKLGIKERVVCLDGGHLPTLVKNSQGVVVANSTSGIVAIHNGVPTLALSESVYNLPGLTYRKSLREFWHNPEKPDETLYNKFANYVITTTQRNGNFYNPEGIKAAVANSAEWLLQRKDEYSEHYEIQKAS